MRNRVVPIWLCVLVLLAMGRSSGRSADRVELSSGEVFYGRVLKCNEDEVAIQLGTGGVLTFRRSNVKQVRRTSDDSAEGESTAEPAEAKKSKTDDPRPVSSSKSSQSDVEPRNVDGKPLPSGRPTLRSDAPDTLLTLARQRLAISPPRGFQRKSEDDSGGLDLSYWDPGTQATFTMVSQKSTEPVEELKKQALQTYGKAFSAFTILRNERLKKGDKEVKPETWIVESECQAGKETLRQIQVFSKRDDDFFVLTYNTSKENYEAHRELFEKSLSSLRFLEASESPR